MNRNILFLLVPLVFSSCASTKSQSDPTLDAGWKEYKMGNNINALKIANESIKRNPTSSGYHLRGSTKRNIFDVDGAIADYQKSLQMNPSNPNALIDLGSLFWSLGRYSAANQYLQIALTCNCTNEFGAFLANYKMGLVQQALRRPVSAVRYFDVALTMPSNDKYNELRPSALIARAQSQFEIDHPELGFDDLVEAVQLNPKLKPDAIAAYRKAVAQKPEISHLPQAITLYKQSSGKAEILAASIPAAPKLSPVPVSVASAPQPSLTPAALPREQTSQAGTKLTSLEKLTSVSARPPRRIALVIGNGAYQYASQLANPTSDSNAVAAVLRSLGFKVLTGTNVGRAEMEAKLIEFGRVAEKSDQAIVYYAGHGVQINGTNYFLPIDAQISDERDLRKYFSAESVIKDAAGASQIAIVMFDACRDNPFARSLLVQNASRGFVDSRGLAPPSATPPNTMVVYATAADNVAADGTGEHSPFTTGLLRFLDQPGLEIGLMFRKVRDEVAKITDGKQIPFTYGSIGGDEIYLATATSQ